MIRDRPSTSKASFRIVAVSEAAGRTTGRLREARFEWDVLPDGRILAIQRGEEEDDITHFDIVLGWTRELREQMAKAAGAGRGR